VDRPWGEKRARDREDCEIEWRSADSLPCHTAPNGIAVGRSDRADQDKSQSDACVGSGIASAKRCPIGYRPQSGDCRIPSGSTAGTTKSVALTSAVECHQPESDRPPSLTATLTVRPRGVPVGQRRHPQIALRASWERILGAIAITSDHHKLIAPADSMKWNLKLDAWRGEPSR
jgi:hypothetical protein